LISVKVGDGLNFTINPINLASNYKKAAVYQVEPYVIAADVYASPDHIGRGGWTWYTGAAAWMYRLILESLLGLRLEVDRLHFSPQLPEDWQEFQIHYRFRETNYDVQVKVKHANIEALEVNLDGQKQIGEGLQLADDKMPHKVEVTLYRKLTKIQAWAASRSHSEEHYLRSDCSPTHQTLPLVESFCCISIQS